MDLLYAMLHYVDGYIDLDKPSTVDQLCVICIKIMAELMAIDQTRKIISVGNKALRPEYRSLGHGTVDDMRPGLLLENLRSIRKVRFITDECESINSKATTEQLEQSVMIDSVKSGTEITQHPHTNLTRVDPTHNSMLNSRYKDLLLLPCIFRV